MYSLDDGLAEVEATLAKIDSIPIDAMRLALVGLRPSARQALERMNVLPRNDVVLVDSFDEALALQ